MAMYEWCGAWQHSVELSSYNGHRETGSIVIFRLCGVPLSHRYAEAVLGHVAHAVCVAGGWCRISSNYVNPSFFLSR